MRIYVLIPLVFDFVTPAIASIYSVPFTYFLQTMSVLMPGFHPADML
jgi:hypothetical protein